MRLFIGLIVILSISILLAPTQVSGQAPQDRLVVQEVIGGRGAVQSFSFSPDGSEFVTNGFRGAYVYDTETLGDVISLTGADRYLSDVAWHPTNARIAGAAGVDTRDGRQIRYESAAVYVWDIDTPTAPLRLQLPADEIALSLPVDQPISDTIVRIDSLLWNPTNNQLAVVSALQFFSVVAVWDTDTGDLINLITLDAFEGEISVAWRPDGSELVIGQIDTPTLNIIYLWNLVDEPRRVDLDQRIVEITWNTEGLFAYSNVERFTLNTSSLMIDVVEALPPTTSPNGDFTYTLARDEVTISSASDGESIDTISLSSSTRFGPGFDNAFWTTGGDLVASIEQRSSQVYVWDSDAQALRFQYVGPATTINALAATPDGMSILIAEFNGQIKRIGLDAGDVEVARRVDTAAIVGLDASFDGTKLAIAQAYEASLLVYDLTDGVEVFAYTPPDFKWITALDWHPRENLLVTGDITLGDGTVAQAGDRLTVRVWDMDTFDIVQEFSVESILADALYVVEWSPDGEYFAGILTSNQTGRRGLLVWNEEEFLFEIPVIALGFDWLGDELIASGPIGTFEDVAAGITISFTRIAVTSNEVESFTVRGEVVYTMQLRPDNDSMVATRTDEELVIYTLSSGDILASIPLQRTTYTPLAWSPDGRFLAIEEVIITEDNDLVASVQIWEVSPDGTELTLYASADDHVATLSGIHEITWISDTQLATAGGYGEIIVWEFNSAE